MILLMKTCSLLTVALLIINTLSEAQPLKNPDSFLIKNDPLPAVFLVGSFHFAYYNLDAHTVSKDKQIDVLSPQKQQEMARLVAYIAQFKPTKIVVEARNSAKLGQRYRRYKTGQAALVRDEIDQIAFRLGKQFNLDTLYAGDASAVDDEMLASADSAAFKAYLGRIFEGYDFKSEDTLSKRYIAYFNYETDLTTRLPLLDYFAYTNSTNVLTREYGAYLSGDFTLGTYRGADALALYWYDRNLRIFRNIQRITTSPNDRILVLFGRGHISLLNQLFSATPAYKYIRFNDLPKGGK